MIDRTCIGIRHQILLADISDIAVLRVFGEQVVKWLILCGSYCLWYGGIPFFAIGKYRINIEHDAAKIKDAVAYNVTDIIPRFGRFRGKGILAHDRYIGCLGIQINRDNSTL